MLVLPNARALLLKLSNPYRVLEALPSAKQVNIKGSEAVVVPLRLEEAVTLQSLGFDVPSPILHFYEWEGRFKPYEHQKQTAAFLTLHKKALVLNDIGTGKTVSALWAADYLMSVGAVRKTLIMSPLSTLKRVWDDAVFSNFVGRKSVVLHGSAERRRKLLKTDVDFYIVNHDGFGIIADECHGMFDLIIVDEAAVLRNPGTRRFKELRNWMARNPDTRLWLMTGTPTPNEPSDAWALARLVDSPFIPKTYTAFREQVMYKIRQYTWVPRPESVEIVKHVLHPAIRYTRDECFDLPDTVFQTREVELTPEQSKHYQKMVKHLTTEAE